ncbi:MAG: hypothetical protein PHF00_13575, partial [Elusimicrobia bacterium]|nr:hypothetical protein [Elusimicrobiota bacterium]
LEAQFRDLSDACIVLLRSESVKAPLVDAKVRVRWDLYREFEQALAEAGARLDEQVRASPELAAFAAGLASRRPAPEPSRGAVSSEVDQALYRRPADPLALALAVAVDRRADGSACDFAERDAAAVRAQLIGLGWPDGNVLVLTGRRATLSALRQALDVLKRRGPSASRVAFYFSGVAAADAQGRSRLMVFDAGLPLDEVLEALAGLGSRGALAILDAPAAPGAPRPGLAVLAGAGAGQARGTDAGQGHGLFTLELLRALRSAADEEGRIAVRAVFERAAVRLKDSSASQTAAWSAPEGLDPEF